MWRNALAKQVILVLICAALFSAAQGAEDGLAALYGGATALLNVQLLRWRKNQVRTRRGLTARASLVTFFASALERFVLVAALLALGLGWIELQPLALLIGFAVGQAAVLLLWSENHALRDRSKHG
ncbi:MAG: ATP synthase subunit I [Gammaproteobacteria bacterium]|nr:ATP synthase subunit I [Gammaproteobacteria bacterium]